MSDLPDLEISKLPSIDAVNKDTDYLVVSKESTAYASGYGSFKVTPNQLMQAVSTTNLSDLEDVNISSPENDQVLKYNGSSWVNSDDDKGTEVEANPSETATDTLTSIKINNDVYSIEGGDSNVIANPTGTATSTLNKLQVDETIYSIEGGGVSSLTDLDDTSISNPTNGQVLKYNSSTSKWENDEGGGSADYVELTQLQYDALSDAEKKNGKMYFITDANGDGSRFMPVIYSEEEREIGVWTDGKPLYEKTINFGALPDSTEKSVAHSISDVDKIWIYDGFVFTSSNTFYGLVHTAGNLETLLYNWDSNVDRTNVTIATYSDRSALSAYITIRYTKTTDQAGSGTWTPQGVPAVHYSTDEHVVGTWIDGSTLYERVFDFSTPLEIAENVWATTNISNSNIGTIVNGWGINISGSNWGFLGFSADTGNYVQILNVRNAPISLKTVILRYTKSSS